MEATITASELKSALSGSKPPLVIDVRKPSTFRAASDMIAGSLRRDPATVLTWAKELPRVSPAVVYCVHGHEVSRNTAKALRDAGITARFLEGGLDEGWKAGGGELASKPTEASTRWVTRERPKIDRIACPWLIARFIDKDAEFLYVPAEEVKNVASARQAVPYDIPDVAYSHDGDLCSFDAFIKRYHLHDPALAQLAVIVRGADTAKLDLAPQSPGLVALSLGLSRLFRDDHEMLRHGMVMYDALYLWCKQGQDELNTWNPAAYR